jgi:hypothetical protein
VSNVDPLGDRFERSVFPEAFLALLGPAEPAEPDMLPVVFTDEPVVVPHVVAPPIVLFASANVLESAKAVTSAIVASYPSCLLDKRQLHRPFYRSLNSCLSAFLNSELLRSGFFNPRHLGGGQG